MNDPRKTSAPKSHENLVKEAKELLQNISNTDEVIVPDKSPAGLKRPCIFGKHNPNFNKKYLNE